MISLPIVTPPGFPSLLVADQNNRHALETLNRALEGNPESKFVHKYFTEVSARMEQSGTE